MDDPSQNQEAGARSSRRAWVPIGPANGFSLIEVLVSMSLMLIAIGALTGMLVMSFRHENTINASFRSQLDVRQALYDMEKQIAETKRFDADGNLPIMQNDAVALPNQAGGWTIYEYATPYGKTRNTILRIYSPTKPVALPIPPQEGDKALINTWEVDLDTTDERLSVGAPIFTYFANDGSQIAAPVVNPRIVHSIKVSFMVTVSKGHAVRESSVSTVQINLRNF